MTSTRHVVLLGLMSSGKTSVGRRVAAHLDRPLVDGGDAFGLFERQVREREPLVLPLADLVVDVVARSKDEQADTIAALL